MAGIVSHGHPRGCNQENTYDVYTSVSEHIGWLNQTILQYGGMSACEYVLAIEPTNGSFTIINFTCFVDFITFIYFTNYINFINSIILIPSDQ